VHRDLGMCMRAEDRCALDADRAVAQRRAFRRASDNSDMARCHDAISRVLTINAVLADYCTQRPTAIGAERVCDLADELPLIARERSIPTRPSDGKVCPFCDIRHRAVEPRGWVKTGRSSEGRSFRPAATSDQSKSSGLTWPDRPRGHRHRHAYHRRDRRRGRVARDGALLEIVRRHPLDAGDLFGPRASAPHRRPNVGGPPRRDQALLERGRRLL
jgi:hypothetical protein